MSETKKVYASNKKAKFNYEIIETFSAGISLKGIEAKSIQLSKVSIMESFISVKDNDVFWKQGYINLLNTKDQFEKVEETRDRRLLLKKSEIRKIREEVLVSGFTCIPLEIYRENFGKIKMIIGIAKGKKLYDKRESLKEKSIQMDIKRELKNY